MPTNRTIDFYHDMAGRYDQIVQDVGYRAAHDLFAWMTPHFRGSERSTLDLGIGTGLASEVFARHGFAVTGIDGSEAMLALAREKNIAQLLIRADLSSGILPPLMGRFDVVVCMGLFEFVLRPEAFIKSVAGVMEAGSLLALAIRDAALNPQFTAMDLGGQTIDRAAYEGHGVIAVHHLWSDIEHLLNDTSFTVLEQKVILAYRSPTQGFDTMNRIVLARYK